MISVVCNLDSRLGVDGSVSEFSGHNNGTRSWDFFTHGLVNKRKFFNGHDIELIAFVDEHGRIPNDVLDRVRELADCVVLRKHTTRYRNYEQAGFTNDINYLHALSQARGDTIVHFDADTAAFSNNQCHVDVLLERLCDYRFVSYPSKCSPLAVDDPSFMGRTWASTRFFACRRETLRFDILEKALREPEWAYERFGTPARKCCWLEHFLSITNEESVIYPPRVDESLMIFCWDRYKTGIMEKLNNSSYETILQYVNGCCGGIHYPNDVTAQ